jgi:phosphoribosylaminoimidazole-succinocarboxamide synthase
MNNDVMIRSDYSFPVHRRGKVRDLYDLSDSFLIVSTDRISAFDVVFPNGIPKKGSSLNSLKKHNQYFPIISLKKKMIEALRLLRQIELILNL